MKTYTNNEFSITIDGMTIPKDTANRHYQEFLELLEKGEAELVEPQVSTEQLADQIRSKRNQLIAETDYLVMPDYPITEKRKQKVLIYRQALRDITVQETFPQSVIWPVLED